MKDACDTSQAPRAATPRKGRSARRALFIALAIVVLMLGAIFALAGILYYYQVFAYDVRGTASNIADVPHVGPIFAAIENEGRVAYYLRSGVHGGLTYTIVGFCSKENVSALLDEFEDVTCYIVHNDMPDGQPLAIGRDQTFLLDLLRASSGKNIVDEASGEEYTDFLGINPKTRKFTNVKFREKDGLFYVYGVGWPLKK